jgi:microcystin-dependent protein
MDAYVGEIRLFAGSYAPTNWAICDGSVLNINSNPTLYSLLGTTYGGDGSTTFALPDLRGRVPVHFGQLTGGSYYNIGQKSGTETAALSQTNLPSHSHTLSGGNVTGNLDNPSGNVLANTNAYVVNPATNTIAAMDSNSITQPGGNSAHNNVMPFQVLNYIICTQGLYPPRN